MTEHTDEIKFKKLRSFNGVMAVLHFVQALLMLTLSNSFALPITRVYLKFDAVTQTLVPTTETLYNLRIGPLVALFLFISAFAHLLISTALYKRYIANLKRGINFYRWYEYALSSSIMIVVIAMLVGMYDIGSIILIFSLNATMILFGLMMELHNQTTAKTDWTSFIFGCFAGLIPWVVIAIYLLGAGSGQAKPPDFVYYIFLSIAILFNCFVVNMYLQYKKVGKWKDYLYGERMYVILSLVAKSLLAWQVFAGTLRPV